MILHNISFLCLLLFVETFYNASPNNFQWTIPNSNQSCSISGKSSADDVTYDYIDLEELQYNVKAKKDGVEFYQKLAKSGNIYEYNIIKGGTASNLYSNMPHVYMNRR